MIYKKGNTQIDISDNSVYHWCCGNNVFVRGYAFKGDTLFRDAALAECFSTAKDALCAVNLIKELDGFFSVIILFENEAFAAVDHLRSMPLFYCRDKDANWTITDSLSTDKLKGFELDKNSLQQFRYALEVIGRDTLLKGVRQLQAGEYAVFGNEVMTDYWWQFSYAKNQIEDKNAAIEFLHNENEKMFRRLIKVLDGRTAVIPLSGGHDSRYIAYYLKKLGYDKVIAYSYGRKDNEESTVAAQVAKALGIPFYFIEYEKKSARKWAKQHFNSYLSLAGNAVSVPCIQETYAVFRLLEDGIASKDCVFVPGYGGSYLDGATIIEKLLDDKAYSMDLLTEALLEEHFFEARRFGKKTEVRDEIGERAIISDYLQAHKDRFSRDEANEIYEKFGYMERQAKFVMNAPRTYEYYGFQWATPEFERRQIEIWTNINYKLRYQRHLFFEYEKTEYPEEFCKLPFAGNVLNTKQSIKNGLLSQLSRFSPLTTSKDASYMYVFAEPCAYAINLYLHRNRSVNYWVSNKYISLMKKNVGLPECQRRLYVEND